MQIIADAPVAELHPGAAPSGWQRGLTFIRALYSRPISAISTTLVLVFLLLALVGPVIAPYGENQQIVATARQGPSAQHWFGTDHLGRDVFSRVILGTRAVIGLSGGGTLLAVLIGATLGLLSGYRGGWFDEILMRLFDSLMSIPVLLLALLLLGTLGRSRNAILLVIVVVYAPIVARVVRSVVLGVKTKGFVEAARLRGESLFYMLSREILPSVLPALAVESALRFSYSIFLVASLGFLGIGVQPPSSNWGMMVNEARDQVRQIPWSMYAPIGAIALLVVSVNLLADSLKRIFQQTDV
ncbi:MAG: ABC transporter permease [Chloroflexi bacterium]|nr:MAG: ABC transporter permease [Chloroflexota bacterium]